MAKFTLPALAADKEQLRALAVRAANWLKNFFAPMQPRDIKLNGAILFAITLLPLFFIGAHAAPQIYDFCMGKFMHQGFWGGLVAQYNTYGHQFLGRSLNLLPLALVEEFSLDYFYIYASFIIFGMASFVFFARWMVLQLLPTAPLALKATASISLTLALLANAPTVRELIFSLPGLFTYALPGLSLGIIFLCFYRTLAAQRDFSWPERLLLVTLTPIVALSNEWSGLALMGLLLCAFITRLRLVPEAPAPIIHAMLLGISIMGAILLLLGPQDPIFSLNHLGSGFLWSAFYTPEFFLLRLPLPGVLGWFLLLSLSYRPELRGETLSERHRQLLSFTLVSLLVMSFVAFTFGYLPSESRLSARAQNELFVVVVVALSVALCLVIPMIRFRLAEFTAKYPALQKQLPLLTLALMLSVLSPGVLASLWQMGDAPKFRDEARARLSLMINRAEPTVYVPQLTVQPSLLFDRDVSSNANNWKNSCIADFFQLDRVLPQPSEQETGN